MVAAPGVAGTNFGRETIAWRPRGFGFGPRESPSSTRLGSSSPVRRGSRPERFRHARGGLPCFLELAKNFTEAVEAPEVQKVGGAAGRRRPLGERCPLARSGPGWPAVPGDGVTKSECQDEVTVNETALLIENPIVNGLVLKQRTRNWPQNVLPQRLGIGGIGRGWTADPRQPIPEITVGPK